MAGGKSYALAAHIIKCQTMWPGSNWVLARYRGKDLKKTTLPIYLEMLPSKMLKRYNKSDGEVELVNNSKTYFSDLEDPNKLKSLNLAGYGIDEATDVPTIDAWNMLTTRLRQRIKGVRYFGLLASNPEPGWVKDLFITEPDDDFSYFEALPADNPTLPEDYIATLEKNLPTALRERYLRGSWDAFDDLIIRPEWVLPHENRKLDWSAKVTFVDPAISEKTVADETAIVTVGVEIISGLIEDIEVRAGRWSFDEIKKNCEEVYQRHKPDRFVVEDVQAQNWLIQDLIKDYAVVGEKVRRDKIYKAMSVQDYFENGRIRVNDNGLRRQLTEFPNGTHDDKADAFFSALRQLKQTGMDEIKVPDHWWKPKKDKYDMSKVQDEFTFYKNYMG